MTQSILSDEEIEKDIKNYPLGKYGELDDISNAVVYFLSDASKWVTGTNFIIDGGRSLK